jgi:hypothetical protein
MPDRFFRIHIKTIKTFLNKSSESGSTLVNALIISSVVGLSMTMLLKDNLPRLFSQRSSTQAVIYNKIFISSVMDYIANQLSNNAHVNASFNIVAHPEDSSDLLDFDLLPKDKDTCDFKDHKVCNLERFFWSQAYATRPSDWDTSTPYPLAGKVLPLNSLEVEIKLSQLTGNHPIASQAELVRNCLDAIVIKIDRPRDAAGTSSSTLMIEVEAIYQSGCQGTAKSRAVYDFPARNLHNYSLIYVNDLDIDNLLVKEVNFFSPVYVDGDVNYKGKNKKISFNEPIHSNNGIFKTPESLDHSFVPLSLVDDDLLINTTNQIVKAGVKINLLRDKGFDYIFDKSADVTGNDYIRLCAAHNVITSEVEPTQNSTLNFLKVSNSEVTIGVGDSRSISGESTVYPNILSQLTFTLRGSSGIENGTIDLNPIASTRPAKYDLNIVDKPKVQAFKGEVDSLIDRLNSGNLGNLNEYIEHMRLSNTPSGESAQRCSDTPAENDYCLRDLDIVFIRNRIEKVSSDLQYLLSASAPKVTLEFSRVSDKADTSPYSNQVKVKIGTVNWQALKFDTNNILKKGSLNNYPIFSRTELVVSARGTANNLRGNHHVMSFNESNGMVDFNIQNCHNSGQNWKVCNLSNNDNVLRPVSTVNWAFTDEIIDHCASTGNSVPFPTWDIDLSPSTRASWMLNEPPLLPNGESQITFGSRTYPDFSSSGPGGWAGLYTVTADRCIISSNTRLLWGFYICRELVIQSGGELNIVGTIIARNIRSERDRVNWYNIWHPVAVSHLVSAGAIKPPNTCNNLKIGSDIGAYLADAKSAYSCSPVSLFRNAGFMENWTWNTLDPVRGFLSSDDDFTVNKILDDRGYQRTAVEIFRNDISLHH